MTLVTLGSPLLRFPGITWALDGAPAPATDATLDAAGEYVSYIFQARESMVISHVGWRTGAVAGAPTGDTRIETVGADGLPTGTLWAANTNLVSGTLVSNTWTLHALTASATIAKGDFFAVKIVYASGTSIVVQRMINIALGTLNIPYKVTNTSGSAVKDRPAGDCFQVALGSSTTTFYSMENALPINSTTNSAFNNGTAGDKRGLRFQVPFACRCAGLAFYNSSSAGDFIASLMDDSGTELSSSSTAFEGDRSALMVASAMVAVFDSPVILTPGTWYRVAVEPSSATSITVGFATLPNANYRSGWPGGLNHHYTTFTTAGGWIDTATDQVPWMDILLDQIDDGAGGAGGGLLRHPGMLGGLAA